MIGPSSSERSFGSGIKINKGHGQKGYLSPVTAPGWPKGDGTGVGHWSANSIACGSHHFIAWSLPSSRRQISPHGL